MKVIALCQAYNEALFARKAIENILPLVDGIVVTEGLLTPFGNMPKHSPDGTRDIIRDIMFNGVHTNLPIHNDINDKMILVEDMGSKFDISKAKDREACEGINKNCMLSVAIDEFGLETGDVIFILDFDEFFEPEAFKYHIQLMKDNPDWNFIRSEEWQFAYNLRLAFKSSHGRFMRYIKGSRFGTTNHFIHPNGVDITKKPNHTVPRNKAGYFHLCWVKSPALIREKVISFNRPSFTTWFNYVYLVWPQDNEAAYANNSVIPPYYGKGFCEGQHEKLVLYHEKLPNIISDLNVDWLEYVRMNRSSLLIR